MSFLTDPLFRHESKTMNPRWQEVIQIRYPRAQDHNILSYLMWVSSLTMKYGEHRRQERPVDILKSNSSLFQIFLLRSLEGQGIVTSPGSQVKQNMRRTFHPKKTVICSMSSYQARAIIPQFGKYSESTFSPSMLIRLDQDSS